MKKVEELFSISGKVVAVIIAIAVAALVAVVAYTVLSDS